MPDMFPSIPRLTATGLVFVVVTDDGVPMLVTSTHEEALLQIERRSHVELMACH